MEIGRKIKKLKIRITEVKALTENRYNDQEVEIVEDAIKKSIKQVFGASSDEFAKYRYYAIWKGGYNMNDSEQRKELKFQGGIEDAVKMLDGLIKSLKEDNDYEEKGVFVRVVTSPVDSLNNIFDRFHAVAKILKHRDRGKEPLLIQDEYDVQYLLHALFKVHFLNITPEDYVPSYAGSNSRTDFTLKEEKVVIEVKITNSKLKDKQIGEQLVIDIARYRSNPACETLFCFIYDPGEYIKNAHSLISDLDNLSTQDLKVIVRIEPHA
jgi:hypothetical protein